MLCLQAHLKWREANGIDTILEDFHFQVRAQLPLPGNCVRAGCGLTAAALLPTPVITACITVAAVVMPSNPLLLVLLHAGSCGSCSSCWTLLVVP